MVNYQNGKIYKIVNNLDNKIYIGSTCSKLSKRLGQHKGNLNKWIDNRLYAHILLVGWNNISIILIEPYPCNNKDELLKRERYFIEQMNPELNKQKPRRTKKEWINDNEDKIKDYRKTYREQQQKKRTENIKSKEEIEEIKRESIECRKEYMINFRQREEECKCGRMIKVASRAVHFRSNIHKKLLQL